MDSQSLYQTSYFSTLPLAYFHNHTPLTANASFFDVALRCAPLPPNRCVSVPVCRVKTALLLIKMDHVCQHINP
jgi:hypothetical protein